jgi:hypothetical protein
VAGLADVLCLTIIIIDARAIAIISAALMAARLHPPRLLNTCAAVGMP